VASVTFERRKRNHFALVVWCISILTLVLGGCASVSHREENVLATVNGEYVTENDLKFALERTHRKDDLTGAGALDVSVYLDKVIDDMLVIEEAKRMGLERDASVQKAVRDFLTRESVVRLHRDEVLGKVVVTEEDLRDFFNEAFDFFTLGLIVLDSEETAGEVLEKLRGGGDFTELAEEYSTRKEEGWTHEIVLSRKALSSTPELLEAVVALKPGELSGPVKSGGKYYIVELRGTKEPDPKELEQEHVRKRLEKELRDQKEKERGSQYIAALRAQAPVFIDEEVLASIDLKGGEPGLEKLRKDNRTLARVYDEELTVSEFTAGVKPGRTKEDIVDGWIAFKVVDHEALSRHYETDPELSETLESYQRQLLRDAFIKKAILPKIVMSDEVLQQYYAEHGERFASPVKYGVQQIMVKSEEAAMEALKALQGGADFLWVRRNKSIDATKDDTGAVIWRTKAQLSVPERNVIDSLEVGQISPIVRVEPNFKILRLAAKSGGDVPEFSKIRESVREAYFRDQFESILAEYVAELRDGADIRVNEKALRALEEKLGK